MPISRMSVFASVIGVSLMLSACAAEPEPVEDQVVVADDVEEVVEPEVPRHPLTGFELGAS